MTVRGTSRTIFSRRTDRLTLRCRPIYGCIQLRRPDPDLAKISRMMRNFFFAVGMQGTMQVLTIVIMARFVTGL
jgi:hypothetical protein